MTTGRNSRAMRIFEQLADLPAEERAARLDELCAGDAELRSLAEAMLAADARTAEPFAGGSRRWSAALDAEEEMDGRAIGAWRIVRAIGRGGMGAVYEAQRADGAYAQRAALKLIRGSADSPAARERFLRERQLLAQLQHPNIATLLDGGFAPGSEPYFVMEYVDGVPIDRWCDERRLGLRERIALFLQVLDAVAFAHRNLVVHRDLKPSNILVDTGGRTKLLDFGIAKELEDSAATATHDRALTLEYASPEQLHAAPITTATDVWQLGVVLHRLLSGAHPFGLSSSTPLPKQVQLLERDPEPLTRAAAQASEEQAALRGGLLPAELAKALHGALSNIVLGCLGREPAHAYPSAEAVADDLQRWLDDRPLRIAPPGRALRARLWLRRNRLPAAAAAVALLAIVGGSGVALWQAYEARQQARIAERESATSREALAFLTDTLAAAAPENALSTEVSVRQLLDKAREQLDGREQIDPLVRQAVQRLLGRLYHSLGETKIAVELLEAGLRGLEPQSSDEALALAEDISTYSFTLGSLDRGKESLAAAERAAALRRRFADGDPLQEFKALEELGYAYHRTQDYDTAEKQWLRAVELARTMPDPPMDGVMSVLNVYQMLSSQLSQTGDYPRALQLADDALALADARGLPAQSPGRAVLLEAKAEALAYNGDPAAAEPLIRQAIAIHGQTTGATGTNAASTYNLLGTVLNDLGRYREAIEALEHGRQLRREANGAPVQMAVTLGNIGATYESAGDYARALELFEASLAAFDEAGVEADAVQRRYLERNYARGLVLAGRFAEADTRLRRLQQAARRLEGEDSVEYALLTWNRVVLARRMGDAANGQRLLEEARARWAKVVPETHRVFTQILRYDAAFARQRGDLAAAERAQREAVRQFQAGAVPVDLAIARAELAAIRFDRGDRAEARRLLGQALPIMRDSLLPQEVNRAEAEALARKLGA